MRIWGSCVIDHLFVGSFVLCVPLSVFSRRDGWRYDFYENTILSEEECQLNGHCFDYDR